MSKVLGIVYRYIATHLIKKAGFSCTTARTGAVANELSSVKSVNNNLAPGPVTGLPI